MIAFAVNNVFFKFPLANGIIIAYGVVSKKYFSFIISGIEEKDKIISKLEFYYKKEYIIEDKMIVSNKLSNIRFKWRTYIMADSIILLEERKEVTTFLLDEGTITATTVTTPTGETPGYEYAGNKVKVDDAVTLSARTVFASGNIPEKFRNSDIVLTDNLVYNYIKLRKMEVVVWKIR